MADTQEAPVAFPLHDLAELTETINFECAAVAHAEASALDHAIAAGHALIAAKALVPGSWMDWVAVNLDVHHASAVLYMRVAHYESVVREQCATSLGHAREIVRHLPKLPCGQPRMQLDEGVLEQVRSGEISIRGAARALGVTNITVKRRIDPTFQRGAQMTPEQQRSANRRARDARAALRQQEQARAARKAGGGVAEAYALVRQTLQVVDRAMGEVESKEVKAHLATATRRLHAAEDEIVRASKLS